MKVLQLKKDVIIAITIPVFYLIAYSPYGMDTTDFGYFYGYAWRILNGQLPYRDFFYIKPALPLYWHAFWLWLTPLKFQILAGKMGFCLSLLASSWLGSFYIYKYFNINLTGITLPVLATVGFVFSVHTFPHMPWHTADGVLFAALALYLSTGKRTFISGIMASCAMLCKQSFAPVPLILLLFILINQGKKHAFYFGAGFLLCIGIWLFWLLHYGALDSFREMTTGQLDIREAIDAGILIYIRQNWLIPAGSILPFVISRLFTRSSPVWLQPAYWYIVILTVWYMCDTYLQKTWIGYGTSWPTFFMVLGILTVIMPQKFLAPVLKNKDISILRTSMIMAAPLCIAWCTAISGGYKIPAFFSVPLVFSFFCIHAHFFKISALLQYLVLISGLTMFFYGYQYPYVFPVRPLEKTALIYDGGDIYPQASGVKIDLDMYERLKELAFLRRKYGPAYKTLPGFSFAYYLNGDKPVIRSDWLIDWEINGKTDELYNELMEKNVTVFMEKDQLETEKADGYDRAGYSVPQKVRKNWKIVETTPHFVVFQKPD